ncbi:hypothetical protein CSW98_01260 [Vibrio sp. HA2012]|uniref:hypothetical protein n=1 Tax=Vibrio sp. HA2012 TaxID=1971595 RepID=UPI000C2C7D7E|nr:hypothetical protein [Vibrio sp. HA2012]PJC87785.1 hypothetical protein CSW98_01260 [Vibrio sp. HA2012]
MLQVNTTNGFSSSVSLLSDRLALLSHKKQWVLFTSECPRPSYEELSRYHINCNNIIQIKHSSSLSEEEIVIKAIKAGTASAIIASDQLSASSRHVIEQIARQHHCEVFFVARNTCSRTYH